MQALEDLDYLAALDDDGNLSEVGIIMSELPLDPQLAKALLASCEFDCVHEMLTLAAMLTGKCPFSSAKRGKTILSQGKDFLSTHRVRAAPNSQASMV